MHYSMKYSVPVSLEEAPSGIDSVFLDYGRDTVAYTFVSRDSTLTRNVPLHEAFPFLGQSMVGLDLALRRLRAAHADSGVIVANETSNLVTPPRTLRLRLAGDSAYLGSKTLIHLTPDGGFLDMSEGKRVMQPAPSLDIAQLTKHFVEEYAPRVAAVRKAAASRVEIALPAAQLDRFVGSYGRGAVVVTREGERLAVSLSHQSKVALLAMSQTSFFVRRPDLLFTFEIADGSGGDVKGVTIAQGESKQQLVRDK